MSGHANIKTRELHRENNGQSSAAGPRFGGPPGAVLFASDGRCAGRLVGTALVKRASAGKHQLRRPPAWAVDVGALRQAQEAGATEVVIRDLDSGMTYRTPIDAFWRRGFSVNRGFGEQQALALSWWQMDDPRAPRQLTLLEAPA